MEFNKYQFQSKKDLVVDAIRKRKIAKTSDVAAAVAEDFGVKIAQSTAEMYIMRMCKGGELVRYGRGYVTTPEMAQELMMS